MAEGRRFELPCPVGRRFSRPVGRHLPIPSAWTRPHETSGGARRKIWSTGPASNRLVPGLQSGRSSTLRSGAWHPGTDSNRELRLWRPLASPSATGAYGAPGWIRTSTRPVLSGLPLPVGLRAHGRLGRIRTDTGHGLSVLPLRVGLRACGVRGEIRTRNNAALDRTRLPVAPPEHWWAVKDSTSEIPKGYRVYSAALSANSANCPNTNCQRSGGRQATRTPMSRGTLA